MSARADLRMVQHLASHDGDDGLGVDQRRVAQVVEATLVEDGGAGLEPHGAVGLALAQLGADAA